MSVQKQQGQLKAAMETKDQKEKEVSQEKEQVMRSMKQKDQKEKNLIDQLSAIVAEKVIIHLHYYYRVYPVMENLEKSWTSIFLQAWKSHGNWLQVLEIHKAILSRNAVVHFFHPAFQYKDTFM